MWPLWGALSPPPTITAELAGTVGLAALAGGHGRPELSPGHMHAMLGAEHLTRYLFTQLALQILYGAPAERPV